MSKKEYREEGKMKCERIGRGKGREEKEAEDMGREGDREENGLEGECERSQGKRYG